MSWLKWLFCPHDWSKLIKTYTIESVMHGGTGFVHLYQCSKCTRFKKLRVP